MNGSPMIRRLAALFIAAAGLLHGVLAGEYLSEKPYIGVLFVLAVPLTLAAAVALWRRDQVAGWAAGALIASGMMVLFVLSRTVGLPGYHETDWEEGIPTLVAEAAYLALAVPALLGRRGQEAGNASAQA